MRTEHGDISARPAYVLHATRSKLTELWCASDAPVLPPFAPYGALLPPLTVEELRLASARFKVRTATAWDGFSPTHYQHISDYGLHLLS